MEFKAKSLFSVLLNFFIVAVISLEINFGIVGLKVGNLILLLFTFFITTVFFMYKGQFRQIKFNNYDTIFLMLVLLSLFSAFWSPSVVNTIFHSALLFAVILSVKLLTGHKLFCINHFTVLLVKYGLLVCLISLASYFVSSTYALQPTSSTDVPELRGIFTHQLRLGQFCTIILGVFILQKLDNKGGGKSQNSVIFSFAFLLIIGMVLFFRLLGFMLHLVYCQ